MKQHVPGLCEFFTEVRNELIPSKKEKELRKEIKEDKEYIDALEEMVVKSIDPPFSHWKRKEA